MKPRSICRFPGCSRCIAKRRRPLIQELEFHEHDDPTELGKIGEALVTKYMEEAAPRIEPLAVELRVEGVISGVRVTGYVDLIDVNGCVIDIKTAKRGQSVIDPMYRFQVATYCHPTPLRSRNRPHRYFGQDLKLPRLIQQPFPDLTTGGAEPFCCYIRKPKNSCARVYIFLTDIRCFAVGGIVLLGGIVKNNGAARFRKHELRAGPSIPCVDSDSAVPGLWIDPLDRGRSHGPPRLRTKVIR